jgi:hypothetical protein
MGSGDANPRQHKGVPGPDGTEDRTMMPQPAFAELLRRVVAGDQQAAARLARECEPVIRREVRVRLRGARARRLFDSLDVYRPGACHPGLPEPRSTPLAGRPRGDRDA